MSTHHIMARMKSLWFLGLLAVSIGLAAVAILRTQGVRFAEACAKVALGLPAESVTAFFHADPTHAYDIGASGYRISIYEVPRLVWGRGMRRGGLRSADGIPMPHAAMAVITDPQLRVVAFQRVNESTLTYDRNEFSFSGHSGWLTLQTVVEDILKRTVPPSD